MAVTTTISRKSYMGDGVTTVFPVPFYFLQNSDLIISIDGSEIPSGYTVSGAGNEDGGSVTITPAPAGGSNVLIVRSPDELQETRLPPNDPFPSQSVERMSDKLTMLVQRHGDLLGRAPLLADSDVDGSGAYRAKQNRLQDLGNPVNSQDAVNLRTMQTAIANFLVDGAGDVVMSLLADADGKGGAALIGFNDSDLASYIGESSYCVVTSIASLRALDKTLFTKASATGYFEGGDGGGGHYFLDSSDTSSLDNGGTIIVANDGGRWKLTQTSDVTVKQFGVRGDGTTDDTAAWARVMAWANAIPLTARPVRIAIPRGVYPISQTIWFQRPVFLHGETDAMINYSGTFCALKLGADNITNFDVFLQGEYTVDNLRFTGGASAVYGIFINEFVIEPRIRNCTFEDYGNVDSWDIYASWQCWNLIISNCRKFTHSSTVAVGSFIAVPGQNKAATQYDGGNSRVSIEDCWMTCYNGLALGAFALVNATKSRIIGGGFQMSSGGILLGGHASGTLIDGVYSELSTAHNPFYVQAFSIVNSSGNYSPQQVIIQNGYINMHQEDIGSSGRMIHAGDSSVLISDWTVENMSISNFANGQSLVDQINVAGQKGNQYRSIKPLFVPASADNGARFVIRNGLSLAEPWNSLDISHGKWTPSVGGTATYGARTGTWHKVGEQVTCTFDVPITTLGTGSATQIFGLPFPALSSSGGNIGYFVSLATNVTSLYCRVDSGASAIILTGLPAAGNTVPGTLAVLGDSSRIIGSITYTVADLT